ncbi:MAG: RNA polymerase sigma factor [Candidatus Margulisiibacteriota bacterium]|jgi:RNA polymerase sigma-70 factor (ECF subfamily)
MHKIDFEKIFLENKDKIWHLISKYVYLKEDKEDLFQEIFINIHKALPKFRSASTIETWIYKITVNTAINYIRKQKRYKWVISIFGNLRATEHAKESEKNETQILKLLDKLNPQQRMILLLSDIEEKKLGEIAKIMKMPIGTIKSNLHRARQILKKSLLEKGSE